MSKRFMSMSQALKALQVTEGQFRRLCIMKGVYPKDPKKLFKGHKTTYYLSKDIKWLLHEPIIKVFHDQKSFTKKIAKAKGRGLDQKADRLIDLYPQYSMSHIIKQRYPDFNSALRDLDEALSHVALFANIPANSPIAQTPTKNILNAKRLLTEFHYYVVKTSSLQKVFCTIKGYFFQASILGTIVTWLVPLERKLILPTNIDYTIMFHYLEYYEALLGFSLYKLYNLLGIFYPPLINSKFEEHGISGLSLMERSQKAADQDRFQQDQSVDESYKQVFLKESSAEAEDRISNSHLFSDLIVFISREAPRQTLEFLITSCGGKVCWDGIDSEYSIDDPAITHHIMDRPVPDSWFTSEEPINSTLPIHRSDRIYVQPQWIFDCINCGVLIPTQPFAPGSTLPPHLSPFEDYNNPDVYQPKHVKVLQKWINEAKGIEVTEEDTITFGSKPGQNTVPNQPQVQQEHQDSSKTTLKKKKKTFSELLESENPFKPKNNLLKGQSIPEKGFSQAEVHRPELISKNKRVKNLPEARIKRGQPEPEDISVDNRESNDRLAMQVGMMKRKKRRIYKSVMSQKQKAERDIKRLKRKADAIESKM